MTTEKKHRWILALSLGLCMFLYFEPDIVPVFNSEETVIDKVNTKPNHASRKRAVVYKIITDKNTITLPALIYHEININDVMIVKTSMVTRTIQQLAVTREDGMHVWNIGFIALGGYAYLVPIVLGSILLMIFYRKLPNSESRASLTFLVLSLSVLVCILSLFFK